MRLGISMSLIASHIFTCDPIWLTSYTSMTVLLARFSDIRISQHQEVWICLARMRPIRISRFQSQCWHLDNRALLSSLSLLNSLLLSSFSESRCIVGPCPTYALGRKPSAFVSFEGAPILDLVTHVASLTWGNTCSSNNTAPTL
jgi:hypothetical protein